MYLCILGFCYIDRGGIRSSKFELFLLFKVGLLSLFAFPQNKRKFSKEIKLKCLKAKSNEFEPKISILKHGKTHILHVIDCWRNWSMNMPLLWMLKLSDDHFFFFFFNYVFKVIDQCEQRMQDSQMTE